MLTTKLTGTHICPPSAVMPSPSMGACHDCQPQHARRHVAHHLQHVFRRQLSQSYVHCLSWCENSQRRVSSRPHRSKATQNSVFASTSSDRHVPEGSVSVVLLAGGSGKRMKASMPKQYLNLVGQPIAMHSLRTFGSMPEVGQIVVVCDPSYRDLFQQYLDQLPSRIQHSFAIPGVERQDSVYSGLQSIRSEAALVAIHDSARPLIDPTDAANCMADAQQVGAAVLGVPVKPTIKEVNSNGMVVKTLIRANLWEVQTPQVIQPDMLREGFELVRQKKLEVTDDVSIIEALGRPVKVTQGSYTNIKVTTPDDMLVAEGFLMSKGVEDTLEAKQSDLSEASVV